MHVTMHLRVQISKRWQLYLFICFLPDDADDDDDDEEDGNEQEKVSSHFFFFVVCAHSKHVPLLFRKKRKLGIYSWHGRC